MTNLQIKEGFVLNLFRAIFKKPVQIDGYTDKISSLTFHCISKSVVDGHKVLSTHLSELGFDEAEIQFVRSLPNDTINELPNPERVVGFSEWVAKSESKPFSLSVDVEEFMNDFHKFTANISKYFHLPNTKIANTNFSSIESAPWYQFEDSSYILATGISDYLTHTGYNSEIVAALNEKGSAIMYLVKSEGRYFDILGSFESESAIDERPYGASVLQLKTLDQNNVCKLAEHANNLLTDTLDEFDNERWFISSDSGEYTLVESGIEMHYVEAFDHFALWLGQHYFQNLIPTP